MKILIAVALLVTAVFIYKTTLTIPKQTGNTQPSSTASASAAQTKTFQSETMKFSIDVPTIFKITEANSYVDLSENNQKINISKNGTNFKEIGGYLTDFDKKRTGLTIQEERGTSINNYNAIERIESFSSGPVSEQKIYYIYIEFRVYTIATSDTNLYPALDQIAQSFKYTP